MIYKAIEVLTCAAVGYLLGYHFGWVGCILAIPAALFVSGLFDLLGE